METIPEVAAAFLRDLATVRAPALSINPLSPEEAALRSSQWQQVTPFAALLGLIPLENANNSNPYCLITRGPCTGMVFHRVLRTRPWRDSWRSTRIHRFGAGPAAPFARWGFPRQR